MRFRIEEWRFWLASQSEPTGLLIILVVVIPVLTLLLWLIVSTFLPLGPVTTVEGRIVGMGYVESERGSWRTASVELEDGVVRTALPERYGCRVATRSNCGGGRSVSDIPTASAQISAHARLADPFPPLILLPI